MLTTSKITIIKYRFLFILNIVIISELISHYLKGTELFSNNWLYSAFSILLSYIFYMIFIENYIIIFSYNSKFKQPVMDLLRLTLLIVVSKIITNLLETGIININLLWIYKTLMIVTTYFISDIILADFLIKFNNYQLLFYYICKVLLSNYLIILLLYKQFTLNDFIDQITFLISYIFYEIIIKKFIN
jgi:hypothetical protein